MKIKTVISLLLAVLLCTCGQQAEHALTVCFTGDVLLDRGVREQINRKGMGYLFEGVAPLFKKSDATVINLECPVTNTVSPINKQFIFRADSEWVHSLSKNGITHATLANNHSLDHGRRGLDDTYMHLTDNNIIPIGYGKTHNHACQPVIISKNGIDVAIFSSIFIPLENWVFLDDVSCICQSQAEETADNIRQWKNNNPKSFVVVTLHWGVEYQLQPTLKQRRDAAILIDAGADAIIGHHPHVIQEVETYKGKPVFYSIGNFIFDQTKPNTTTGLAVQLHFDKDSLSFTKHYVDIRSCKPVLK